MTVPMNNPVPTSWDHARGLYEKNIKLEKGLRRSTQSKVPSDHNAWLQMRENYECIILEDHRFSEIHDIEYALWRLHYRRIEEFRTHFNATKSYGAIVSSGGRDTVQSEKIKKFRSVFRSFLTEATGFYHDLILKISAKFDLPFDYLNEGSVSQDNLTKDQMRFAEIKKGLVSCHHCLIYLGDLARYKGLYGEGDLVSRDYSAASTYYLQAASLCPWSGNPHQQLAILASYSGDELLAVYRYFRSLAVESSFPMARDNLVVAFEKNRRSYGQLPGNVKVSSVGTPGRQSDGQDKGSRDARLLENNDIAEFTMKEQDLSISEVFRCFCTRFVRLAGILFTRTSIENFEEVFTLMTSDLHILLSSGPDEVLNFGPDASGNATVILRLIAILIFSTQNVKSDSENQSYANILQHRELVQSSFTATFKFAGYIIKRCTELHDAASSYLFPAILTVVEWLASLPDIAASIDDDEKQAAARSFFWNQCVSLMNKLVISGFVFVDGVEDEFGFLRTVYNDRETDDHLALWEDFELRGFLPLVPAQVILDFSVKHTYGSSISMQDKKSRVQRLLAAVWTLINVVSSGQKRIYIDPNLKKFVLATEAPLPKDHVNKDHGNSNFETNVVEARKIQSLGGHGAKMSHVTSNGIALSKLQPCPYVEEEEEEEIVFKPTGINKSPATTSKWIVQDTINSLQASSSNDGTPYATQHNVQLSTTLNASSKFQTTAPYVSQIPLQHINTDASKLSMNHEAFLSYGPEKMNIFQNDHLGKKLEDGLSNCHHTLFSSTTNVLAGHFESAEVVIPSVHDTMLPLGLAFDSLANKLPAPLPASRKNPVSRPVKNFRPLGFGRAAPNENFLNSSLNNQLPHVDVYSWFDDYQTPSRGTEKEHSFNKITCQYPVGTTNTTSTMGNSIFSFGKQVSKLLTQMDSERSFRDFCLLEQLKPHGERDQAQSFWCSW